MSRETDTLIDAASLGVKWTSLSAIIVSAVQFSQIVIMARLLSVEQYGLLAIILLVLNFTQGVVDLGLNNAVVQNQKLNRRQLSNLYWVNLAAGFFFFLMIVGTAEHLAVFFGHMELREYFVFASLLFPIISTGSQYRALLQKSMAFSHLAKIDIVAHVISLLVLVLFALQEVGIWAYLYAVISQHLFTSICLLVAGFKRFYVPRIEIYPVDVTSSIRFGLYETGNRGVNLMSANVDKILIGRLLGAEALGYYTLAWQLAIFPLTKLNPIFDRIAFPVYSKLQKDSRKFEHLYHSTLRFVAAVSIPILIFVGVYSSEIVEFLYGPSWSSSASLVTLLAFVGILKALANPGGSALLSVGRSDVCLYWNLFWLSVLVVVLLPVTYYITGVKNVAIALLILSIVPGLIWHHLVYKYTNANIRELILSFLQVVCGFWILAVLSKWCVAQIWTESPLLTLVFGGAFFWLVALPVSGVSLLKIGRTARQKEF